MANSARELKERKEQRNRAFNTIGWYGAYGENAYYRDPRASGGYSFSTVVKTAYKTYRAYGGTMNIWAIMISYRRKGGK
jgi:hypothetical protein